MADRLSRDWITPAEVEGEFGVAKKTLANHRSRGEGFPYTRLPGGRIRYSRKAIQASLEENVVAPAS